MDEKINPNPEVFKAVRLVREDDGGDDDDGVPEPFDTQEIYDLVRDISDPEHPHTLEELKVMQPDGVVVDNEAGLVSIRFTPTIPHCRRGGAAANATPQPARTPAHRPPSTRETAWRRSSACASASS